MWPPIDPQCLTAEVLEGYKTDSGSLKEFLDYHTASPKTCKCDFENDKLMESGVEGKKLRLNSYSPFMADLMQSGGTATVQCAKLVRLDDEACGAMVHTLDKVLLPPGGKVVEILKDHGREDSNAVVIVSVDNIAVIERATWGICCPGFGP